MVYINHDYHFIFIENPKSGSTSIMKALSESLNVSIQRTPHLQNAHQTPLQVKKQVGDSIWNTYIKVTTYRDPIKRFISSIQYPRHHQLRNIRNFNEMKKHLKQQYPYRVDGPFCQYCIPQEEFLKEIDFIIHLDNIQQDFDLFCHKVGIKTVQIQKINSNYNKMYNNAQISELLSIIN